ncbi:glycosyltransferase [Reyranella sp.]|uniref:glycosyltransferase n=1 Tax=Reyranella sp. TaxID=1929291 RepID=UPI003C7D1E36
MDSIATSSSLKLGSAALEDILCRVSPVGVLGELVPHATDAWSIQLPGLDALPRFEGEPARLRICIATEDIVGPVRNGGIGTTYSALSELLAKLGHDVTILYLKGHEVENGTIEQWIDFYAAKSVKFVPVPNYAATDKFQTGADRWLHAPYNMLKYLTDHPMDVVHVSEWRGSGYLSLLAKRQRLAFQETLFIVKTSSPWIWNRLYGSQPLDRIDDLAKVHAERRSVEFADIVIGGSLHLLRWMASQGYSIPRDRTFVQPNVATFDHLSELMTARNWARGQRHPIDEIVFFGRLEARKGLFTFVQAIKRLLRQNVQLPPQITFMGKPGARLMARPDQDIVDYITSETADWPTKVEILSEFQQYDALKYLLSGNRLAVMPSTIENSSLAVYEAAICGIPFIASASGGTPELVAAADHEPVLCEAHPIPLADKIAEALKLGGYVAHPSFDNNEILEQWRRFHLDLGRGLLERLLLNAQGGPELLSTVSVCVYHTGGPETLRTTLQSIKEQDHPPEEVLIAVDTDDVASLEEARSIAEALALDVVVVPAFDLDAGLSFNLLAEQARGDFLLFLWAGSTLRPMALRALTKVAASSNAELVNYFFRVTHSAEQSEKDYLSAIVLGNIAQSFFRTDVTAVPLLVRRRTFAELGGFTSDYRVLAHDHELVAKAQISGVHCETALLELGTVPAWDEEWLKVKCYDQSVALFRAIRPELAAAPLALRELLLMAKGLQQSGVRRRGPANKKPRAEKVDMEAEGPIGRLLYALSKEVLEGEKPAKPKPPAAPAAKPAAAPAVKPPALGTTTKSSPAADGAPAPQKAPSPSDGAPAIIRPQDVASAVRRDVAAARQAAVRGAGLVKLIDELSADVVEVEPSPPKAKPKRERVTDPRPPVKVAPRTEATPYRLSSSGGQNYSGRLLGVYDGTAYGWVRNDDRPDDVIEVEVVMDGAPAQLLRADESPPTVLPPSLQLRGHGFVLPLWNKWEKMLRKPSEKNVLLRIKDTRTTLASFSARRDPSDLQAAGFDGHCDIVDANLQGWVWRPADPQNTVDVSVFVDGSFLSRTTASLMRDDLKAAGVGDGGYGFRIPLPKSLRDGTPRRVDVVVAESGVFLKQGRLTLVGDELSAVEAPTWTRRLRKLGSAH